MIKCRYLPVGFEIASRLCAILSCPQVADLRRCELVAKFCGSELCFAGEFFQAKRIPYRALPASARHGQAVDLENVRRSQGAAVRHHKGGQKTDHSGPGSD